MKTLSKRKIEILSIAKNILAEKGYGSTSMNDIAVEVGIKKASLYSHFESKEEIFNLILNNIILNHEKNLLLLLNSIKEKNSILKLEKIFFKYIEYCYKNTDIDFWTRFYYFPPLGLKDDILHKTHTYEKVFENELCKIIEQGIKDEEIKDQPVHDIMLSYYYLLIGFNMSLNEYPDEFPTKEINKCVSVFLNGIKL